MLRLKPQHAMPWKSTPHAAPLSTTARDAYVERVYRKPRKPILQAEESSWMREYTPTPQSTHRLSYNNSLPVAVPAACRPSSTSTPLSWGGGNTLLRSTSQDSFMPPLRFASTKVPGNFKPPPKWTSVPHVDPMTSTMRSTYGPPPSFWQPRAPTVRHKEGFSLSDSEGSARSSATPRSTSRDAYNVAVCLVGRAATPLYPKSNGRVYGSDQDVSTFQTTYRSSFLEPPLKAYLSTVPSPWQ